MKDKQKNPESSTKQDNPFYNLFTVADDFFHTIVRTSPDGIAIADMERKIIYANENCIKMMGIRNMEDALGTKILDWIDPDYHKKAMESLSLVAQGREDRENRDNQFLLLKRNGLKFFGAINAVLLYGEKGKPIGMLAIIRDISDIKAIEEELRENGNRYFATISNLSEGIVIANEDARIIEWNSAMEIITGTRKDEAFGKKYEDIVFEHIPPEKRTDQLKILFRGMTAEILKTGKWISTGMESDIEIVCKDGSKKYIKQTVFPIPVGNNFHLGSVTMDVTKRRQTEDDLRQREIRYRLLFESAHDSIFLMDEHVFIDCNPKTLETFGCNRDEIIGKSPMLFSPPQQPDGSDSEEKAREKIQAALQGMNQVFDWKHKKLNGTLFDAEVSLNRLELQGKIYLQAMVRNISKRKKSNEQLRKFSECLLSFGIDPDQNINLLTALCGEILNATSAFYNRINKNILCSLGQWNTPPDYMSEDRPDGHICYDVIKKDNHDVYLVRNLPKTDYFKTDPNVKKYNLMTYVGMVVRLSGKPLGSLCAVFQHDYTPDAADNYLISLIASAIGVEEERRAARNKLLESSEELKEINLTKDKFFSIIAHDLKGPFNAILGFSEILSSEWDDFSEEEKLHFIRNISSSAKNTFQLLENLLEWSISQTGRLNFNPSPIDLSVLANEMIILFREQADRKQIKLFTAINFGTVVLADENMIRTVFRNLVSNAIKFTKAGGQVKITATETPSSAKSSQEVEVCISDNGIGIPPDTLPRLFRVGEQVRTVGTYQEKGTGLGLVICKELIEKNNGNIFVESEQGKGSKFCFRLPAFFG